MRTDWMTWAVPLAMYGVGLLHHYAACCLAERTRFLAARQQKQYEMVREAIALKRYGAQEEAEQLLEEAIELGKGEAG
jgi:hypothetical protein